MDRLASLYTDDDDFVSPKAASLGPGRRSSSGRALRITPRATARATIPRFRARASPASRTRRRSPAPRRRPRRRRPRADRSSASRTTASVMMIVAHPDDEDGALLTYLSRGLGVRVTLLTLTRGEGGQNAMSADSYDALGLIRTNELLKADEYYGAQAALGHRSRLRLLQNPGRSLRQMGPRPRPLRRRPRRPPRAPANHRLHLRRRHHRRPRPPPGLRRNRAGSLQSRRRPQRLPRPVQTRSEGGLGRHWQPLAVYSMVPFARIENGQMFDYATGKWAPAKFNNYVTGEWIRRRALHRRNHSRSARGTPSSAAAMCRLPAKAGASRSRKTAAQIPALSGPASTSYHLWAVAPSAAAAADAKQNDNEPFHNPRSTSTPPSPASLSLAGNAPPAWLTASLHRSTSRISNAVIAERSNLAGVDGAHKLAPIYRETLDLYAQVASSDLDAAIQSQSALRTRAQKSTSSNPRSRISSASTSSPSPPKQNGSQRRSRRSGSADETPRSVYSRRRIQRPRPHLQRHPAPTPSPEPGLRTSSGESWGNAESPRPRSPNALVPSSRPPPTPNPPQPYFTRPTIEQPYYDLANHAWRERSFAPWPLSRLGRVHLRRPAHPHRPGRPDHAARRRPRRHLRASRRHARHRRPRRPRSPHSPARRLAAPRPRHRPRQAAAEGTVALKLPDGWRSNPPKHPSISRAPATPSRSSFPLLPPAM